MASPRARRRHGGGHHHADDADEALPVVKHTHRRRAHNNGRMNPVEQPVVADAPVEPVAPSRGNQASTAYYAALNKLEKALHDVKDKQSSMYTDGLDLYQEIQQIGKDENKRVSIVDLTKILTSGTLLIKGNEAHPLGDDGYRDEADTFHQLAKKVRTFPVGKILGGIMLGLLGTVVVAASGIVAAASFGLLAPIAAFGAVLGTSMAVGAVATVAGALGAGAVMGSGMLFFSAAKKDALHESMKGLEDSARSYYDFKKR